MRSLALVLLIALPSSAAAIPVTLNHQGRLFDNGGAPLNAPESLTLSLYDSETASVAIWSELLSAVPFDNGYFRVTLGELTPLDSQLLNTDELWVGMAVGSSAELGRQRLSSVPYALLADTSVNVSGGVADVTELLVNNTVVVDTGGNWVGGGGLGMPICADGETPLYNGAAWGCVNQYGDQEVVTLLGPIGVTNPLNHERYTDTEAQAAVGLHYADADVLAVLGDVDPSNSRNHDRYTDAQAAIAAGAHYADSDVHAVLGALDDANPLNHERYTDTQAAIVAGTHYADSDVTTLLGALTDTNPYRHERYTNTQAAIVAGTHYADSDVTTLLGALTDTNPYNHDRFTALEAKAAMGQTGALNPMNHDRYLDSEARAAMGVTTDTNSLNHHRFRTNEAVSAMGAKANNNTLNHDRYDNAAVMALLGTEGNNNPLNHQRYLGADAVNAMGPYTDSNPLYHNRYNTADAKAAMGTMTDTNPYNHIRYQDYNARFAMGVLDPTNAYNHDRYTGAEAITAVGPHTIDTDTDTHLTSAEVDAFVVDGPITGNLDIVGSISATGNLAVNGITASGNLAVNGITASGNLAVNGITATGNLVVNDVSANNISANNISGVLASGSLAPAGRVCPQDHYFSMGYCLPKRPFFDAGTCSFGFTNLNGACYKWPASGAAKCQYKDLASADAACSAVSARLCTVPELDRLDGTGCGVDTKLAWANLAVNYNATAMFGLCMRESGSMVQLGGGVLDQADAIKDDIAACTAVTTLSGASTNTQMGNVICCQL